MKQILLAIAVCLLFVSTASAQAVSTYTFKVYNQGAAAPVQTSTLQAANVLCNQAAVANPGQVANPSKTVWDDPANAGKACTWSDPGTGILFSLPFGAQLYQATLTAVNGAGTSPESARSNLFTRPGTAPSVLTGVLVTQ